MSIILNINIRKYVSNILSFLPFVIFTILVNLIFSNLIFSTLVGIRLLIVCNMTFIISYILTPSKLSTAISYLLYPLKMFKVNINDISLIITIAISLIPILIQEGTEIKYAMIAKNFKYSFKNVITRPHIFMITYMNNVFDRIKELELSLNAKAYD
jgi:energy-coupling factor transport system permease protein